MRELHQRGVIVAGMGVGIANAAVKITNAFYFRHRPFDTYEVNLLFYPPTDSSFPANPVAITIAMATGVWMANRKIGAAMFVVALVYGFSRVYAGVFYPLDVLGGALIGLGAAYLVSLALKLIEPVPTLCLRLARYLLRRLSGDCQDPNVHRTALPTPLRLRPGSRIWRAGCHPPIAGQPARPPPWRRRPRPAREAAPGLPRRRGSPRR